MGLAHYASLGITATALSVAIVSTRVTPGRRLRSMRQAWCSSAAAARSTSRSRSSERPFGMRSSGLSHEAACSPDERGRDDHRCHGNALSLLKRAGAAPVERARRALGRPLGLVDPLACATSLRAASPEPSNSSASPRTPPLQPMERCGACSAVVWLTSVAAASGSRCATAISSRDRSAPLPQPGAVRT